jgi:hypothetical protein
MHKSKIKNNKNIAALLAAYRYLPVPLLLGTVKDAVVANKKRSDTGTQMQTGGAYVY